MEQQDLTNPDFCIDADVDADANSDNIINIHIDMALRMILVPRLSQEKCKCAGAWKAFEASEAYEHIKAFEAFMAAEEEAEALESSEEEPSDKEAFEAFVAAIEGLESSEEEASDEEASEEVSENHNCNIIIKGFNPNHYCQVIKETGARKIMAESLKALHECPSQPPDALQFIREHFFSRFDPKMEEYWDKRVARTSMALEKEALRRKSDLEELVKMKEESVRWKEENAKLKSKAADMNAILKMEEENIALMP